MGYLIGIHVEMGVGEANLEMDSLAKEETDKDLEAEDNLGMDKDSETVNLVMDNSGKVSEINPGMVNLVSSAKDNSCETSIRTLAL